MIDAIRQIPEMSFLLYYILFFVACYLIGWLVIFVTDKSLNYSLPELNRFLPVYIAFLRGGYPFVIQTEVHRLWKENIILIDLVTFTIQLSRTYSKNRTASPIEQDILSCLQSPRNPGEFARAPEMKIKIDRHLELIHKELADANLARTPAQRKIIRFTRTILAALLGLLGGVKLAVDIYYSNPVIVTFFAFFVLLLLLFISINPFRMTTILGRIYLRKLKNHYYWQTHTPIDAPAVGRIDYSYGLALFGLNSASADGEFFQVFSSPQTGMATLGRSFRREHFGYGMASQGHISGGYIDTGGGFLGG